MHLITIKFGMKKLVYIISISLSFFSGRAFSATYNNHNPIGLRNYLIPKDTAKKADADTADDEDIKHRTFEIGLKGASDQASHGLHGVSKLPYLEPSFTYTAKSGFYIEVSDQFVFAKKYSGFYVFGLNPGWDIDLTDNTTLGFSLQFYRVNPKADALLQSSFNNELSTYIEQDVGDFEGKLTIAYDIYNPLPGQAKTPSDIIFTPDITYDHEFDFKHKQSLHIEPEVNFEFGTRNIYTQYQNALVNDSSLNGQKIKGKGFAGGSNASFGTLDFNLMLTIEYKIGKFKIEPAITYAYPLYKPSGLSNSPSFYGSITLGYKIRGKK